jgi:polar amino acid transport system substrate-binding protein
MKKLLAILLTVIIAVSLTACAPDTTNKLEAIKSKGTITVYTDPNFAPFEFAGEAGPAGVDIEIAYAIAEKIGVTAQFVEAKFDSIIMGVKGGKGDIAISGFTITDERKESVDFSKPYVNSVQYLIIPEGSGLKTMEDLAGKKVGVAKGYTGQLLMDEEVGEKGILAGTGTVVNVYNGAIEAVLDLKVGRIDAVVMDEFVAKALIGKNEGLVAAPLSYANGDIAEEEYGVVIPKGNPELAAVIDSVIDELVSAGKIEKWIVNFSVDEADGGEG